MTAVTDPYRPGGQIPPGWYPDPWSAGQRRYWTGREWTSDTFPDSAVAGPPSQPAAAAPLAPAYPAPPPPVWGSGAAIPAPAAPTEVLTGGTPPGRGSPTRLVALIVAGSLLLVAIVGVGAFALFRSDDEPPVAAPSAGTSPSASPSVPRSSPVPTPGPSTPTPGQTTPGPPAPGPTTPGQPGPGPDAATEALLANLVVRQQDVPDGYLVVPLDGGDQVDGEITLDLCSSTTYPSESLRTARLQVVAVELAGRSTALSTEAVVYESAAATAQAFEELAASAQDCPPETQSDPVTGATTTTEVAGADDAGWGRTPGVERQAYEVTRTDARGEETAGYAVYLRRGPVLLGLYFRDGTDPQMAVEGRTTVASIVKLFEERLIDPPTDAASLSASGPSA